METKKKFIVGVLFWGLVLGIVLLTSRFLTGYLMPLIIGVAVAALLQRPIGFLCEKTRMVRGFWSITLVVLSFALLVSLVVLIGYEAYIGLRKLVAWLPGYIPTVLVFAERINERLSPIAEKLPPELVDAVQGLPETVLQNLTDTLTTWLSGFATDLLSRAPALIFTFFVSIVASCYIAKDYGVFKAFLLRQIPEKYRRFLNSAKQQFSKTIPKMLRGYLIIMTVTFAELCVGLLVLGVKNAIPLSALIALVDVLPVLGVGTVLAPWAVVELLAGRYFLAAGLLLVYLIITIVRSIIEPKIIAGQVGLNPLVTLLAMYCGLKLFGLAGLIGLPVGLIILTALQKEGKVCLWKTGAQENQANPVE